MSTVALLKLIHTATPDTTKLSCLCRVRFDDVNRIPDNSRLSPTDNSKSERVNSNCPIHTATPDTTQTGLFCRAWCGGVNGALQRRAGRARTALAKLRGRAKKKNNNATRADE